MTYIIRLIKVSEN